MGETREESTLSLLFFFLSKLSAPSPELYLSDLFAACSLLTIGIRDTGLGSGVCSLHALRQTIWCHGAKSEAHD
jgi:hypothetical protein